jgi:hypothetical protein
VSQNPEPLRGEKVNIDAPIEVRLSGHYGRKCHSKFNKKTTKEASMLDKAAEETLNVKNREELIKTFRDIFVEKDFSCLRKSVQKELKAIFNDDNKPVSLQPKITLGMGAKVLSKAYGDSVLNMLADQILLIDDKSTMQRAFEVVKNRLIEEH